MFSRLCPDCGRYVDVLRRGDTAVWPCGPCGKTWRIEDFAGPNELAHKYRATEFRELNSLDEAVSALLSGCTVYPHAISIVDGDESVKEWVNSW